MYRALGYCRFQVKGVLKIIMRSVRRYHHLSVVTSLVMLMKHPEQAYLQIR